MKKFFKRLIPIAVATAIIFPNVSAVETEFSMPSVYAATQNVPEGIERQLIFGSVTVYDFGKIKLHAYNTKDVMADEFYAFESDNGIVLLESGAFKNNVEEFSLYLKSLNKPLAGKLLSYHANGYKTYDDSAIYATQGAFDSWQKNGGVWNLTQNFVQGFGADKVAADLPENAQIVQVGDTVKIAGIDFKILSNPDAEGNYSVEIPEINAVYRHMMGSDVHNILPSIEYIDAEIADLETYRQKNYSLILTSHYIPEGQDAVKKKIAYLKKIKRIAKNSKDKADFIAAVKEKFPNYQGENYLEMTAGMLF